MKQKRHVNWPRVLRGKWISGVVVMGMVGVVCGQEGVGEVGAVVTEPVRTLAPVTVIGSAEAVQDLAGSGAFLDRSVIEDQNYTNINRVMARVPGVNLREEDGNGIFPNISMRGVDSSRSSKLTMMEDGILIAPAPYSGPAAYFIPRAGRMDAIEILKGSSQVKYGPHTSGGVINFLSTPIPMEAEGFVKYTYGSDNAMVGHFWYGDTVELSGGGRFGYLFEMYGERSDGFRSIETSPGFRDPGDTGYEIYEPMLKLMYEPATSRAQRVEFKAGYTYTDANESYLGLSERDAVARPDLRYAATRYDNFKSQQFRTHLKHTIEASDAVTLDSALYFTRFERDWFKIRDILDAEGNAIGLSSALRDADGLAILRGRAPGTLRYRHNDRTYWNAGGQTAANIRFDTGEVSHSMDIGLRLNFDYSARDQFDESFTQDSRGVITGRSAGPQGGAGDREEETFATALYIEDAMQIGRLGIKPGIRYEHLEYEFRDFQTGESGTGSSDIFAPGIGLTYDAGDAVTLFGGVYRGYSVPGPRAAIKDGVREETSINYELGVRYNNQEKAFVAEAALFHTDFSNLLVVESIGATGSATTENVGRAEASGVEFAASWDPAVASGAGFRTPLYVSATYTDARLRGASVSADPESIFSGGRDGSRVPNIPEWQFAAGVGFGMEKWQINFDVTYTDSSFSTASNQLSPGADARYGTNDSMLIADLSGQYELFENFRIIAGVSNLFDERAITSRLPEGPRNNAPRSVYAGFQYSF